MKQTLKRTIIASAAVMLLVTPSIASARGGMDDGDSSEVTNSTTSPSVSPTSSPKVDDRRVSRFETELRAQLQERSKEREAIKSREIEQEKEKLHEKLDAKKKKVCENHVNTINRVMDTMNKRRQSAFDRITKVSEAVQAFYVKKGLTVENYDDLVAKVSAAKSIARSATEAQVAVPTLNCDGDHPRADVADFKEKRSASIDAVKAYRDAVKALVKAVKAAAETTKVSEGAAS